MSHGPVNTFAGNPLDRAGDKRLDPAWIAAAGRRPDALTVIFQRGEPLLEKVGAEGRRIAYAGADLLRTLDGDETVFLGLWKDIPVFAADLSNQPDAPLTSLSALGAFEDLRMAALAMPPEEAAICATARAMFEWRRRHRFCANCGAPTRSADGGWKRMCETCQAEHFPRTDPVVIMLAVHDGRCLVGRNPNWPETMFSALAGFVEPGETLEEACARELKEEAGLTATAVRYVSSQPWPWPSSLMIGLIAEVADDHVTPDLAEVAAHHWLTRDDVRAILADANPEIRAPSKVAIARSLLETWIQE